MEFFKIFQYKNLGKYGGKIRNNCRNKNSSINWNLKLKVFYWTIGYRTYSSTASGPPSLP